MFGSVDELDFTNDIAASPAAMRGGSIWPVLLLLLGTVGGFAFWASATEIEEITKGEGRVIPSGQVQLVQTLEGGIVRNISVEEGQIVEKNEPLIQIDDTSFSSRLGELRKQEASLLAERYRLEAEAALKEDLRFPEDFETRHQVAALSERQVFVSHRNQLMNELEVLDNRLAQKNYELDELLAQERKLSTTLAPLEKEVKLTKRMVSRGVVPEIELLRLEIQYAELAGDLDVNRTAQPRMRSGIEEARNLSEATRYNFRAIALERLAKVKAELAVIEETMKAASDRVTRTQLRAPVRGIVNKINVATIGGVVQPGMEIMEIVPIDDSLMIEAQIRPQDVGFLKPDEPASVKLTAYDYLVYGDLKGRVVRIGADTIEDRDGEEFYQVIVRTDKNYMGNEDNPLPIIPGMVATVDIQTGKNTVLSYLLKPILRAGRESLRER